MHGIRGFRMRRVWHAAPLAAGTGHAILPGAEGRSDRHAAHAGRRRLDGQDGCRLQRTQPGWEAASLRAGHPRQRVQARGRPRTAALALPLGHEGWCGLAAIEHPDAPPWSSVGRRSSR